MITKYENATLYTGTGKKLTRSSLVFNDNRIVAVGEEAARLESEITIDGTGKTIIPGLRYASSPRNGWGCRSFFADCSGFSDACGIPS